VAFHRTPPVLLLTAAARVPAPAIPPLPAPVSCARALSSPSRDAVRPGWPSGALPLRGDLPGAARVHGGAQARPRRARARAARDADGHRQDGGADIPHHLLRHRQPQPPAPPHLLHPHCARDGEDPRRAPPPLLPPPAFRLPLPPRARPLLPQEPLRPPAGVRRRRARLCGHRVPATHGLMGPREGRSGPGVHPAVRVLRELRPSCRRRQPCLLHAAWGVHPRRSPGARAGAAGLPLLPRQADGQVRQCGGLQLPVPARPQGGQHCVKGYAEGMCRCF
jgi:hypothetical protein